MSAELDILNLAKQVTERLASGTRAASILSEIASANATLSSALQSNIVQDDAITERLKDIAFVREFFAEDEFFVQQELLGEVEDTFSQWNALVVSAQYADDSKKFLELVAGILNNPDLDVALADLNQYYSRQLGGLPTPTGNPSKLTRNQQMHVRSQKFLSWFGDWMTAAQTGNYTGVSKLIDPDTKEPELLFHGAKPAQAFWRFDMERTFSPVTYLSNDFEYAAWYPRNEEFRGDRKAVKGGIELVYQMFGIMRNPLDLRQFKLEQYTGDEVADIIDVLAGYRPTNIYAKNPMTGRTMERGPLIWYFRYNPELLREFKANTRFDGVIFLGANPSMKTANGIGIEDEFLFFHNRQLKLANARFNSGFVQDIRFKKGGKV